MRAEDLEDIDGRIDRAIAGYSKAEPLAGLECRVLHRLSLQDRRSGSLGKFAFALALAGVLVVVAVLLQPQDDVVPKLATMRHSVARQIPERQAEVIGTGIQRRRLGRPARSTSARLSLDERALLAVARRYPRELENALASLRQKSDEPIRIDDIQISPLQTDGNP